MKAFKIHIALFLLITVSLPNTVLSLHYFLHDHHCENHIEKADNNVISFIAFSENETCLICEQEFFTQYFLPQIVAYSTFTYFLEYIDPFNQDDLIVFNFFCSKLRAPPAKVKIIS